MKKTRVLHFKLDGKTYGGIENYVLTNWNFIDKERFSFDFITYDESLDIYRHMGVTDERVKRVCRPAESMERFERDMKQLLCAGYDVVQFHTSFWTGTMLEDLAKSCGIPKIIVHSHGIGPAVSQASSEEEYDRKSKSYRERHYETRALLTPTTATDFWACSQLAADWLFGDQIPAGQVKIVPNAIDVCAYSFNQASREKYRRELGLDGCFVIGDVSRIVRHKNHQFLLDVFAKVCSRLENAKLLLVGRGAMEERIRAQAEDLGVSDRVVLLGNRPDVPQLLQAMDVFCLPSLFEGLGIALVEAQSAGLKCFASDRVPPEAKLTENLEFLPLEVDRWVEALLSAAKGYERRDMYEEITAAGYNIEQQVKEVERLYLA